MIMVFRTREAVYNTTRASHKKVYGVSRPTGGAARDF